MYRFDCLPNSPARALSPSPPTAAQEYEEKYGHIKLLEVHEIDTSAALAKVQGSKPKPKVLHVMETTFAVEHFGENLGDEFESTPWQCPTVRKASTYKVTPIPLPTVLQIQHIRCPFLSVLLSH
jgi:hypothetical protein